MDFAQLFFCRFCRSFVLVLVVALQFFQKLIIWASSFFSFFFYLYFLWDPKSDSWINHSKSWKGVFQLLSCLIPLCSFSTYRKANTPYYFISSEIPLPPETSASPWSRGGELEPEAAGIRRRRPGEERPLDCTDHGVPAGDSDASSFQTLTRVGPSIPRPINDAHVAETSSPSAARLASISSSASAAARWPVVLDAPPPQCNVNFYDHALVTLSSHARWDPSLSLSLAYIYTYIYVSSFVW